MSREFTEEEARSFLRPVVEALETAEIGDIENRCNNLAVALSHFVPDFWTHEFAFDVLRIALSKTAYDPAHSASRWNAEKFIKVLDGRRPPLDDWKAILKVTQAEVTEEPTTRVVDLTPFLDGTYKPPQPSVGAPRSDGKRLLYPGRWHTVIGPTGTGKSFYALLHCIAEMEAGNRVIYAHFEESSPGGTLQRLRAMAPELTVADILERFVWVDCNRRWQDGEFAALAASVAPSLVVLDGINRAATQHGLDPSHIEAPGKYAGQFVACCTALGATVLSLGHPPKARGRETERHGFGATGWLDDVEGVGFRLVPSQKRIREDSSGYAMLYSVKDRYGQVERGEEPADGKDMDGWYVLGAFWVDSTTAGVSRCGIKPAEADEAGVRKDKIDVLADVISGILAIQGTFKSIRDMQTALTASGVKYTASNVEPALERLRRAGLIEWPEVEPNRARPGRWVGSLTASDGATPNT